MNQHQGLKAAAKAPEFETCALIGGNYVGFASDEPFAAVNSTTGEIMAQIAVCGEKDLTASQPGGPSRLARGHAWRRTIDAGSLPNSAQIEARKTTWNAGGTRHSGRFEQQPPTGSVDNQENRK